MAFYDRIAQGSWSEWTGFGNYISPLVQDNQYFQRSKTLWDVLELLIIPLVLAAGVIWLNRQERKAEQVIAENRIRESTLQAYLDNMTTLLLERNLRSSEPYSEVSSVARSRTLTALRTLDGERKGILIKFLYETALIDKKQIVIDLYGADLRGAHLYWANLAGAQLLGCYMDNAILLRANLTDADLSNSVLYGADLHYANLSGANLERSNISYANISEADLRKADLNHSVLYGANLSGANLSGANLSNTRLINILPLKTRLAMGKSIIGFIKGFDREGVNFKLANLSGVDFSNAWVMEKQLLEADTIEGATMPDGKIYQSVDKV